jgi:hypothetical protein
MTDSDRKFVKSLWAFLCLQNLLLAGTIILIVL